MRQNKSSSSDVLKDQGSPKQRRQIFNRIKRSGSPRQRQSDHQIDDKTAKNRRIINSHLRRIGQSSGRDLSLGTEGICYFQYKKFIIVVEVPDDDSGCFFVYTMVCELGPEDSSSRSRVLQAAMQMNYMQQGTRGACLGLEEKEINLCYSAPACSMSHQEFIRCLDDFMVTAVEMNQMLDQVKERHH